MHLKDILFITKQFFWVGKKRYDIIQKNCEALKERHGECYAYHYTMFLVEYYKKNYEKAYNSFYWLVKNNKAKRKLIDWGIVQFVMTEVAHSKQYDIARKRAYDLLNSEKLNKLQISKLQGVLTYLDNMGNN